MSFKQPCSLLKGHSADFTFKCQLTGYESTTQPAITVA